MHDMPTTFRLDEVLADQQPPMSQRELARRSGVSTTTVNRMCANLTGQVSLATLDALADVLGCKPGDLIKRVPQPRRK